MNTPAAYAGISPRAAQQLDDAGVAFYRLWLDPTLTYSCARWAEDESDAALEAAQTRKLDFHIQQARAAGQARVLDIGCGWGSLLDRLVTAHDVKRAIGLTLNPQQAEWARSRGDPRIEVRVENWFDHVPDAPYDAIISIAAFEAFARPDLSHVDKLEAYRYFFERCHLWLRPGSWMSLQTLGLGDSMPVTSPDQSGGALMGPRYAVPTPADLASASDRLFEVVDLRDDSKDSLRTTRVWRSRLKAIRPAALEVVDGKTLSRYDNVLRSAMMTLRIGVLRLYRVALRRVDGEL